MCLYKTAFVFRWLLILTHCILAFSKHRKPDGHISVVEDVGMMDIQSQTHMHVCTHKNTYKYQLENIIHLWIKPYLENWCLGSEGFNHLSTRWMTQAQWSSPGTHKNQDELLIFGILACLEEDGMETQKNSLVIRGQASLG